MLFSELGLEPKLFQSISELGFTECTEAQALTFQNTFQGKDVIIQSKTGTGKTAAFLISVFHNFQKNDANKISLILVPTRELALQIEKDALSISKYLDYKIGCFYGGVGYKKQELQLNEGVNIMIATPGRLIDFIKSGKISLSQVSYFVVDEADRMFDLGFSQDIEYIIHKLPKSSSRQTIFLSATINYKVKLFAEKFTKDPVEIDLSPDTLMVENVEHYVAHVATDEKFNLLLGLFKTKQPKNAFIFTNTKHAAVLIAEKLKLHGINADYIIGDLPQAKRTRIINRIKNNEIQFLVATDVAARGIHVDNLDMVINYDLPEDPENYVHRVGRTARAGQTGIAYSFVCEKFAYGLEGLEKLLGTKIPVFWPEDELFVDDSDMDYSSIKIRDSRSKAPRSRNSKDNRKPRDNRNSQRNKPNRERSGEGGNRKKSSNKGAIVKKSGTASKTATKKKVNKNDIPRPKKTAKKLVPKRKQKLKTRLEIYQEKYGEQFTVTENKTAPKKKGLGGIVKAISSLFSKK